MPLFVLVQLVDAVYFVAGHHRVFDLVILNACARDRCGVPFLVAGPPNINERARRERVVLRGVHCARFVAGNEM